MCLLLFTNANDFVKHHVLTTLVPPRCANGITFLSHNYTLTFTYHFITNRWQDISRQSETFGRRLDRINRSTVDAVANIGDPKAQDECHRENGLHCAGACEQLMISLGVGHLSIHIYTRKMMSIHVCMIHLLCGNFGNFFIILTTF